MEATVRTPYWWCRNHLIIKSGLLAIGLAAVLGAAELKAADNLLWYRQPAEQWTEALPVGNGRLGAMVFGGAASERIQLNDDTLWTGRPHDYAHKGAAKYLPKSSFPRK